MSTEWFDRKPGDHASIGIDDPTMMLVGGGIPDWVRTPEALGRQQLGVRGYFMRQCPKCQCGIACRHLVLDQRYGVAECKTGCGFVWYRERVDVWTRLIEGITP